jgi:hypothetical protein
MRLFRLAQRTPMTHFATRLTDFGTPFAFYNLCRPSDLPTVVNFQQE